MATTSSPQDSTTSHSPTTSQLHPSTSLTPDTLVTHLLTAKRALNTLLPLLYRANHLVTTARLRLTHSLVLHARTDFLRRSLSQQSRLLRRVRSGIEAVRDGAVRDFERVIRDLDGVDGRLQETMEGLRARVVEKGLRPKGEVGGRSLADFVDEGDVERVRAGLKEEIDRAQEAQAEFLDSIQAYDADFRALKSATHTTTASSSAHNNDPSPIPPLLAALEDHAAEMASLLDSLVRHFDLCVNALKHTEGGLAAVRRAATNNQLPDGVTVSGVIQETSSQTQQQAQDPSTAIEEPMSDEERRQMLAVVSTDAAEVEDVVQELAQRLQSMEAQHTALREHVSTQRSAHNSILNAFTVLDTLSARLPLYIAASQTFLGRWTASRELIAEQMQELDSMRIFYEGYLSSYSGLLKEVERRKVAEEKMRNVMRKALDGVGRLWEGDRREREKFRREVGEWLPSDLWGGLVVDAPRFEVGVVGVGVFGEEKVEEREEDEVEGEVVGK